MDKIPKKVDMSPTAPRKRDMRIKVNEHEAIEAARRFAALNVAIRDALAGTGDNTLDDVLVELGTSWINKMRDHILKEGPFTSHGELYRIVLLDLEPAPNGVRHDYAKRKETEGR
jgi:hypothetical protein